MFEVRLVIGIKYCPKCRKDSKFLIYLQHETKDEITARIQCLSEYCNYKYTETINKHAPPKLLGGKK